MDRQLTNVVLTKRCINATVAGTTAINGTSIDTLGYEAVRFVAGVGALTSTQVTQLKVQESSDNSTWADVTGSTTTAFGDTQGNLLAIVEIYRPSKRYLRPVVLRGTANAVVDFCIGEAFRPSQTDPVTADATVAQQVMLVHPA